mmetsp:Transcript_137657/g.243232  ORF Transcript_137657/g.243232 Transcript_137657/m.243232 type:complete len:384 (-) Transcript_137657:81-1232(-)
MGDGIEQDEARSIMRRFTKDVRKSQMNLKTQNGRGRLSTVQESGSDIDSMSSASRSESSFSTISSGDMPDIRYGPSYEATSSAKQDDLRRLAERADTDSSRYATLLETARRVVSEVKSALYDADHYGQGYGAEVLLEDAERMLTGVAGNTLSEAAQLQTSTEICVKVRQKMAYHLRANHQTLEGLIRRRTQDARAENEQHRSTCDSLWRQIREGEAELGSLPKLKKNLKGSDRGGDLSEKDPVELCGLTLEGAHSLLRAFAAVLRPHITDLMPKDPRERTPAETIALEFLTAADAAQSPKTDLFSEDGIEGWSGGMRRIQSSPMELGIGPSVITQKPQGLIDLTPRDSSSPVFGGSRRGGYSPRSPGVNSEAEVLMKALGESY